MPQSRAREVGRRRLPARRKPPRLKVPIIIPIVVAAVLLVLAGGGFAFAATQEENNSFCASCHTQPESTFFQRFQAAAPVDLASSHMQLQNPVRCIDCHSGEGVTGRIAAMLVGAKNAAAWFSGTATQPAPLTVAIGDANCLKCHSAVTGQRDQNNHFHGFLSRWQSVDPNAATCVSCHISHFTGGLASQSFLNVDTTQQVCDGCHQVLRQ
jgi:predicted CXXCH cytochrome family protein